MPHKDLPGAQDETLTGGLCLITLAPESNFIIVEQLAQARDQTSWNAFMAPTLAQFPCRGSQSTRDEAPGLVASIAPSLEAHHSPDLCHGQHEVVKAVSGPLATQERAAYKAVREAKEPHERLQSDPKSAEAAPAERCPGPSSKEPMRLAQAEHGLAAACREPVRLAEQREPLKARIRGLGHDDHFVDLERGVRRNGRLMAADIQKRIEQRRTVAPHEGLRQSC